MIQVHTARTESMPRTAWPHALLGLALASAAVTAHASRDGVEPAELLPRGECELETLGKRFDGGDKALQVELSCRVGRVQLNLQAEHTRGEPRSQTQWAPEVKWSRDFGDDWRLGVLVGAAWESHRRPRYESTALVGLASYKVNENLNLHLNLGREFVHGGEGGSRPRAGAGIEWQFRKDWALVMERYAQEGTHYAQGALRWQAGRNWSLELIRSHAVRGEDPSRWGLSVSFDLDDD
jgi:hypothetical protein